MNTYAQPINQDQNPKETLVLFRDNRGTLYKSEIFPSKEKAEEEAQKWLEKSPNYTALVCSNPS